MIAEAIFVTIGGTLLPISSIPTILISIHANISFRDFIINITIISIGVFFATLLLFIILLESRIEKAQKNIDILLSFDVWQLINDKRLMKKAIYTLILLMIGFIIIPQGEILPVKKFHNFRTEADGQRLIHFKFFSPDLVRKDLDNTDRDERIGDMWLALDQPYPRGTEVLVTVELDEQNNSLQMMAALKNKPEVKVSCSFSRGGINEEISRQVEQRIKELNAAANLTETGVQNANEIAGEVIKSANQIYHNDQIQSDRLETAQNKLKELENFASEERDTAQFYQIMFEFVLEVCDSLIHPAQKQRLETLVQDLNQALKNNNKSALQKLAEDARREYENLPDPVKLICLTREGVAQAYRINPSHARVMEGKFSQLIGALKQGNGSEINRIFDELRPDIMKYLDQDLPAGTIATGLTR
jgi:molecular chaperone DnaK